MRNIIVHQSSNRNNSIHRLGRIGHLHFPRDYEGAAGMAAPRIGRVRSRDRERTAKEAKRLMQKLNKHWQYGTIRNSNMASELKLHSSMNAWLCQ